MLSIVYTITTKMEQKIIKYSYIEPLQHCKVCERPNHKDNTHCWNCRNKLDTKGEKDE